MCAASRSVTDGAPSLAVTSVSPGRPALGFVDCLFRTVFSQVSAASCETCSISNSCWCSANRAFLPENSMNAVSSGAAGCGCRESDPTAFTFRQFLRRSSEAQLRSVLSGVQQIKPARVLGRAHWICSVIQSPNLRFPDLRRVKHLRMPLCIAKFQRSHFMTLHLLTLHLLNLQTDERERDLLIRQAVRQSNFETFANSLEFSIGFPGAEFSGWN